MSDPKLGPLSPELAELVEAEKGRAPEAGERTERVLSRVHESLAALPGSGKDAHEGTEGGARSSPGARGSVLATLGPAKAAGTLAAVFAAGAIAGGAVHSRVVAARHPPEAASCVPSAPRAPSASVPETDAATSEAEMPSSAPPSAPSAQLPSVPSAGATRTLAARDVELEKERALVDMARSALARGSSASAIAALREHERAFPRGRLSEERDAMLIQVLASGGEAGEALRRAEAFRARFKSSMLLPAVEAAVRHLNGDGGP
jgi:hypothetical protein